MVFEENQHHWSIYCPLSNSRSMTSPIILDTIDVKYSKTYKNMIPASGQTGALDYSCEGSGSGGKDQEAQSK